VMLFDLSTIFVIGFLKSISLYFELLQNIVTHYCTYSKLLKSAFCGPITEGSKKKIGGLRPD
jgi:hypothetical protein